MKIMITGATGFIGKATVIQLAKEGHNVTAVVRNKDSALGLPCETLVWDSSKDDSAMLSSDLQSFDAVVHLAGEPVANSRWTKETKKRIRDSRIVSTRKIVEAFEKVPSNIRPRTFICASAIGYYGDRGDDVLTEESRQGAGFLSEVVSAWETEAIRAESLGVRVVLLRTGVVLGRNGGALQKMNSLVLGSGDQWMSWIHIHDVVQFILYSLETNALSGAFNLVAPHPVRNSEFTETYARVRSQKVNFHVPEKVLRMVLGEMSNVVLDSTRVKPERAKQAKFKYRFETLESALKEVYDGMKGTESRFSAVQFVPKPIEEVFSFFSQAENLETLTPPWLNFHIVEKSTPQVEENTLIDYKLKIHGVPVRWRSRIVRWKPGVEFVDTQISGPYSKWYHIHRFEKVPGGTLVFDDVIYEIPGGKLGSLLGGRPIRNDINKIFAYRMKKISEIFDR